MTHSIVIADDDDTIRRLVEHKLSNAGYEVRAFVNGETAWTHLQEEPRPDLCVLDVMMPGLGGLQVLDRIRSSDDLASTPVILLTSRGREEHVVEGFDMGATDYVTKPFSPRELLSRVERELQ